MHHIVKVRMKMVEHFFVAEKKAIRKNGYLIKTWLSHQSWMDGWTPIVECHRVCDRE